jgi:hypothetical protein
MMNAQLADTLPYRLYIPWQTIGQPKYTRCNQRLATLVTEFALPLSICVRLLDF